MTRPYDEVLGMNSSSGGYRKSLARLLFEPHWPAEVFVYEYVWHHRFFISQKCHQVCLKFAPVNKPLKSYVA
jgi:hypothetical protein